MKTLGLIAINGIFFLCGVLIAWFVPLPAQPDRYTAVNAGSAVMYRMDRVTGETWCITPSDARRLLAGENPK